MTALAGAGNGWLAAVAEPGVSYVRLVAPLVVIGIGNSAGFPALSSAVSWSVHPDEIGQASGLNNTLAEIGGVLGIALVALTFSEFGGFADTTAVAHGFQASTYLCAAICLAGAAAGLRCSPSPRESQKSPVGRVDCADPALVDAVRR